MVTLKLTLYGIGATLFRNPRTLSANSPFLFFFSNTFPLKPPPRFRCCASSAAVDPATADDAAAQTLSSVDRHPWPEWVSFVDRLQTSGYLTKPSLSLSFSSSSSGEGGDGVGDFTADVGVSATADSVYSDVKILKDACLSFARDRYDVFKLLSLKDIQAVVEGGCPNLLRKAVNSAKRLRALVQLDEGDVCSNCNLQGSCDRAYVILKEYEAAARTVDIVRILLTYALDPLVISGGEKPPGREVIELSARKLLTQLIELSESSPPPEPSKPTAQDARAKSQPRSFTTNKLTKDVEMKKGDWMCPKCNFMNFARNSQCLNCNEDKPKDAGPPNVEMKKGDWICPECSFLNFSRNICCLKCKVEGPKRDNTDEVEMKKGDWNCPQCGFMNFASNMKCLRCPEPRPKKHPGDWSCPKCGFFNFVSNAKCLRCSESSPTPNKYPGDWTCPKCDFYNYARNKACLKCNAKRPNEQPTSEYEEHIWRQSN